MGGGPQKAAQIASDKSRALAFAGLRASEILGLARSDIDLERGTVTVRQQISGSGVRATLVETKTASSAATIALPWFVVERLRIHLAHLETERPIVPIGDWLVFVTERGLAVNGSWLTKHFQALLSIRVCPACGFTICATAPRACWWTRAPTPASSRSCSDTLQGAR